MKGLDYMPSPARSPGPWLAPFLHFHLRWAAQAPGLQGEPHAFSGADGLPSPGEHTGGGKISQGAWLSCSFLEATNLGTRRAPGFREEF